MALDVESYLLGKSRGGGSGGTSDYSDLTNKPSINGVTLSGNKTTSDLGIAANVKYYSIKKNDTPNTLKNNFTQWLDDYKNGISDVIVIYDNYSYGICDLTFNYNDGNGTIILSTSYLATSTEYNGYGVPSANIASQSVEATVTNDVITVGNWYTNSGGYIIKRNASSLLGVNNTTEYSVSNNYTPAHKKYVDDAIASAITDALGGNY